MKVEYINPFISSTMSVFSTMLGVELSVGAPRAKVRAQPEFEVSGVIGLSGRAAGTVVLSLQRNTALCAVEAMLGVKPMEIDADVIDGVGELTNMIAGAAKAQLEEYTISLGLPTVISGKNKCISFPSTVTPISIPFESTWGLACVDVGLKEILEPAECGA